MKLLYFAWLRDKTGRAQEEVAPPDGVSTVVELLDWLETRGPEFEEALKDRAAVKVAVNQDYARADTPVGAEDEVAIFPPVTGG